ncbi:hypothetical protein FG386_000746 [Cryptosporidium ryanae]|uniref:uncharacterized protein n=1 Tax=Cryptosporidium ryanae TaxID=515981 RepID=UPI00351A1C98|nr:hypothetical protein FG386_000746 [Cryptosporidium ryanae]
MERTRSYDEAILGEFNYSELEKADPVLTDDFFIVFRRTCPVEIRLIDSDGVEEIGSMESINFRVMLKGQKSLPELIRIEITCDNDLFFYYIYDINPLEFKELKVTQNLVCSFTEFTETFCRIVNDTIKDQLGHSARFYLKGDGTGKLTFIQIMGYKYLELLSIDFKQTTEDIIRNSISFRYSLMKSKVAIMEARFIEISNLLNMRNPTLMNYLQKNSPLIKNKYESQFKFKY